MSDAENQDRAGLAAATAGLAKAKRRNLIFLTMAQQRDVGNRAAITADAFYKGQGGAVFRTGVLPTEPAPKLFGVPSV